MLINVNSSTEWKYVLVVYDYTVLRLFLAVIDVKSCFIELIMTTRVLFDWNQLIADVVGYFKISRHSPATVAMSPYAINFGSLYVRYASFFLWRVEKSMRRVSHATPEASGGCWRLPRPAPD